MSLVGSDFVVIYLFSSFHACAMCNAGRVDEDEKILLQIQNIPQTYYVCNVHVFNMCSA